MAAPQAPARQLSTAPWPPGGATLPLTQVSDERLRELAATVATPASAPRFNGDLEALRDRLSRGRDLLPAARPHAAEDLFPTAIPAIDALLAGGLPRGCLTELRGAPSSGRLSLVLALLAAATRRGEAVALVDLGDHLDPQAAADVGVDLARLLWARPRRLRDALAAAEIALGGAFPLVVLELGAPPLRGKRDENAWLRLARAARHHRGALLVSSPYRTTGTAAAEVLALSRRRGVWIGAGDAPRLLLGIESRLHREKSRREPQPAETAVAWRAPGVVTASADAPAHRQLSLLLPEPKVAAKPAGKPGPADAIHRDGQAAQPSGEPHRVVPMAAKAAKPGPRTPLAPGSPREAARSAATGAHVAGPQANGAGPKLTARPGGPKVAGPKVVAAPKVAGPKVAGPKVVGAKVAGPVGPKVGPKVVGPKVAGPKVTGSKVAGPKAPPKMARPQLATRPGSPSGYPPAPPEPPRRVPRWVPLARAALAESMRGAATGRLAGHAVPATPARNRPV